MVTFNAPPYTAEDQTFESSFLYKSACNSNLVPIILLFGLR